MIKKFKDKEGATTLVELIIVTPIIIFILFYSVGVYQMMMQQSYVEDVKYRMTQKMSREGKLDSSDIARWTGIMEGMRGVKVKNIEPVPDTPIGSLMKSELTVELNTAIFKAILGGEYKSSAVIYSEKS